MPNWTPQQQQAIKARNRTILVSAAAGSGKTAVLVERIVQLIREGWRMDRMLIVTFTKAAAGEMRQRLQRRLVKEAAADPDNMGQALDDLEATDISTIHAFCQKVLRNHFQVVGIDPMVRPCEEQLRKALFEEAWLEAFNQLLEEADHNGFMELAQAWDQKRLMDMTVQVYDFLMSLPAPFDWLERAIAGITHKPYEQNHWFVTLKDHAKMQISGIPQVLAAMKEMLQEPDAVLARAETIAEDELAYCDLRDIDWDDIDAARATLAAFKLGTAKAVRNQTDEQKEWLKRLTKLRDELKKIAAEALRLITIDEEKTDREFAMMQMHLYGLQHLVRRTYELFRSKKADKHVIDFADMEQLTMEVLTDPQSRALLQAEYDHIFVDECQDVSQVQDAILHAIHSENNHLFMVGDVKQSIYRFRKADPTLFLHRMRTFHDEEDAKTRRIFLQKNFRSRYNVLEATNQIFRKTMRPLVTELNYEPEDELICGRETDQDPPVVMHLLDISAGEDGEQPEALEAEAKVLVSRIHELLTQTFDDGNGIRHYTYRDMVILLSAAANTAPRLVEILGREGIPVYYDGAASYYSLPEVQAIKALLSVLDNPLQDIAMLATLKMPPFSLTDADLAEIRLCKIGNDVPFYEAFAECCASETILSCRCREIQQQLSEWQFRSETMRLSDFVWHVIRDSGYYAAVGALPKGDLRQANLRMLYQRAMNYEQIGGETLAGFLELMDQQAASDDRMSAKTLGENEDLVRIMTMHKSKGLEFPVVFCMQMSGRLHKASSSDVLLHTRLGIAMPYVNRELNVKRKTMANDAFRIQRELDEKAERARLLYVAMTRARERLILIGCCKEKERAVWTFPDSDYRVWKAASMTDWLMQGICVQNIHKLSTGDPQPETPWNIRYWENMMDQAVDHSVDKIDVLGWVYEQLRQPSDGIFDDFVTMDKSDSAPLKTSVSALAKHQVMGDPMPVSDADEEPETKRIAEIIVSPLRMSDLPVRPAFMEEQQLTGADRGTLAHRALSLIALEPLRNTVDIAAQVKSALHEMMDRGIFSPMEIMAMDVHGIVGYLQSELGQRMLISPKVRREWGFNMILPERKDALLQGVIDCAFLENDGWILVDYKTDRFSDEDAFRQRYGLQLEWYARALERITEKPVHEMWLYAIRYGKAYLMPRIAE